MRRGALLVILLAMALAGCAAPQPAAPASSGPPAAPQGADALPAFELHGTRCLMGGGHSVHERSIAPLLIPEPWEAADILDDVGPQLVYPEEPWAGVPSKGHTWGNWHVTVRCEGWTSRGDAIQDLVFGFVATRVEAPPFDDGTASRHYIVTVLATSDRAMRETLHAAGFHATMTKGYAAWDLPDVFHSLLDTEDHGVYESVFRTAAAGAMDQGVTRLWWQHEADDGSFRPVALDLRPGGGEHLRAEPNGYFSHLRTHDHDPLPGAAGNTAGLTYTGLDLTVTLGPRPDVRLEKAYVHL
jgi:hypothetical protein